MSKTDFHFFTPNHLIFGDGAAKNIGEYLIRLNSKRILIITDMGLVKAGLVDRVKKYIDKSNRTSIVFSEVKPNPTIANVHKGVEIVRDEQIDTLVAIGGGSPIDAAKAISALVTNKGSILEYELGNKEFSIPGLPLIAIPTTAGTGSEATMASVILDEEANRKFDIVSKCMTPVFSLVDPETTYTLPVSMSAFTGMDALTHAIEGFTATLANPVTDAIHLQAIIQLWNNLETVVQDGTNKESRRQVMMGSMMAGIGFPNSGLGAVHGLSYALSCHYHLGHGLANAILLPHVMKFNQPVVGEKFLQLSRVLGFKNPDYDTMMIELLDYEKRIGIPALKTFDVDSGDFPQMAAESMGDFSNCNTNPRPVSIADVVDIFTNALAL